METKKRNWIILIFLTLIIVGLGVFIFFKNKDRGGTVSIENHSQINSGPTEMVNQEAPVPDEAGGAAGTDEPEVKPEDGQETETENNNRNVGTAASSPVFSSSDSTTKEIGFKIINRLVSWGYEKSSGRKIDTIIIHTTYNAVGSDKFDLDDIINKEYKPYGVSPHYIIDRNGKVYRLVSDDNIAYHAGESKVPDGRTNVNGFSIGIEIVNSKTDKPSEAQYQALKALIVNLKSKYKIKYVLGHDQIAPGRKDDPWNFDWSEIK
jgi:hypothetical protein